MISTQVRLSDGIVPLDNSDPSLFPRFARVKHYPEKYGKTYIVYSYPQYMWKKISGIPEVFQYTQVSNQAPVAMTKKVQDWMFGLFLEAGQGLPLEVIKTAWRKTYNGMRAFTNHAGFPERCNFIDDPGCDGGIPSLYPVMSCGATLKVLREVVKAGTVLAEFECLNVNHADTFKQTWKNNTHLIYAAVNWHNDFAGTGGNAEPFPGLDGRDVPVPLLSTKSVGYIEKSWLIYLTAGLPLPVDPYKF